jgi:hypothetical protein
MTNDYKKLFSELVKAIDPDDEDFSWHDDGAEHPDNDGMKAHISCRYADACIWLDTKTGEWLYALREFSRSVTPLGAYLKRKKF